MLIYCILLLTSNKFFYLPLSYIQRAHDFIFILFFRSQQHWKIFPSLIMHFSSFWLSLLCIHNQHSNTFEMKEKMEWWVGDGGWSKRNYQFLFVCYINFSNNTRKYWISIVSVVKGEWHMKLIGMAKHLILLFKELLTCRIPLDVFSIFFSQSWNWR